MKQTKLTPETIFSSLNLPFSDVILEEIFFLPIEAEKNSLDELSSKTGLAYNKICAHVTKIQNLANNLEWKDTEKNLGRVKIINLEKDSPSFIQNSLSKKEIISFWEPRFKDKLRDALEKSLILVFFSSNSKRAFSSVMYLRGQGYANVYLLKAP